MIAYIEGSIITKFNKSIVVKTNGLGYLIYVNNMTFSEYEEEDDIELYCHTVVREDDISIYGFLKVEELKIFKKLITVSGVGPKSALELLNNPVSSLKYAISNKELSILVNTPGIGKKTAERIIIDLQGKIGSAEKPDDYTGKQEIDDDALNALVNLGYRKQQIIHTLKNKPQEISKTEDIIRYFLQNA